jgi:hypothetical protein
MCNRHKDFDKQYNTKIYKPLNGNFWSNKNLFLEKLNNVEIFLLNNKKFYNKRNEKDNKICEICRARMEQNYTFIYKKMMWDSELFHYVKYHDIKPPSKFILFILENDPENSMKCKQQNIKINNKSFNPNKFSYVKIKTNQLLILDALMEHGGIVPRYKERHDSGYKYSEHAGVLIFDNNKLDRVIISGSSERTNSADPEIFFPILDNIAYEYEYIFHTHPPTPKPGSRAIGGIMYEIPSAGDINHFVEHFNNGKLQGSLVLTPEGLYNIRKNIFNKEKISSINNNFNLNYRSECAKLQNESIKKFGFEFQLNYFYETIAQDTAFIDGCNNFLENYDLHIDFYPRQLTKTGNWIIGTVYLPMCSSKK